MNDESRNLGKRRRKFRLVDLHRSALLIARRSLAPPVRPSVRSFADADVSKHDALCNDSSDDVTSTCLDDVTWQCRRLGSASTTAASQSALHYQTTGPDS